MLHGKRYSKKVSLVGVKRRKKGSQRRSITVAAQTSSGKTKSVGLIH